jgi:SAM-dependent methyltransferase
MTDAGPNDQQATYWTHTAGPHWVQQQMMFDRMLVHFGEAALGALNAQPTEHVLDIGCGTGTSTLEIAAAVGPSGSVTGADISPTMIEAARARALTHPNVSFVIADAQTERIMPIDRPADAMFSRFGVMFFADPVGAFVNIAANVRDGGRLTFVCWQREEANEWISLPADIMRGFTPSPVLPPENAPGPFAFHNPDRVRSLLVTAGWTSVQIDPFSAPTTMGGGQGLEAAVTQSMSTHVGQLLRAQVDDATFAAATAAVRSAFAERLLGGAVTFPGNVWIVTARR